jgi:hypothetical protein
MTEEPKPDAQGDFTRYPFPRLLFYLYKKQFLGELVLWQPDTFEGRIYFRDGLPVFTDMPYSTDVLGRVLVERGLISEEQLYASLQQLSTSDLLQGQLLIQMGALDMGGLIEGLRLQLLRKLNRIFGLSEVNFAIYAGDHDRGVDAEEGQVRADPLWVIYHGVRNTFDNSRLQPELDKLHGMAVGLGPGFVDIYPRYGMREEVQHLVTLLMRGTMPISRVFEWSDQGPLVTQMLLYSLWVTEALVVTPEDQASQAAVQHRAGPLTGEMPHVGGTLAPEASQPQVQPQAPVQAEPEPEAPSRSRPQTAPEVAALAAEFSDDQFLKGNQQFGDDHYEGGWQGGDPSGGTLVGEQQTMEADEIQPPLQPEATEGGTPIITSAPVHEPARVPIPEIGQEGVYAVPEKKRTASQTGETSRPGLRRVPSSPGLRRVPSSPGVPIKEGSSPSAPGLRRVPSSPGVPIKEGSSPSSPIPSSPGIPAGGAGAAANHYQLVKKTHKRIQEENYYEILGVDQKASVEEIRESYFKLAKEFHPDRISSLGIDDIAKEAEEIFRYINDAHTTLTDREKKIEYNEELKGRSKKKEVHDALRAEFAFQKGLVHFRKKNFPEAFKDFQEAYKLNPNEGEHLAYVAWSLFCDPRSDKEKLLPKIKEQLLKAIKISPNSATSFHFLGEIYLALDQERRAFTCFDKVLEIQPEHLEATRHMRIIRMRKEKRKEEEKKKGGLFGRFLKK